MALQRDLKREGNIPSDPTAGDNGDLDGGVMAVFREELPADQLLLFTVAH